MNRRERRRQAKEARGTGKRGNATSHGYRGELLVEEGKIEEAIKAFQWAISIDPQYADGHYNLGVLLYTQGRIEDAVESYLSATVAQPDYSEAHNNLGSALQDLGRLDEAVDSYHKALAIAPDFADAHSNLGNALSKLGKLDEAVASFQKALAIEPNFAEAHSNFGNALYDLGQLDEAATSYHNAIAIEPEFADAHNNLGNALNKLGKLDEAVASFNKALAIESDFAGAHYSLGVVLNELGRYEDAIRSYDSSGLDSAQGETLECLYALERYEEFYQRLDKLIQVDKTNLHVAAISAFASHQLGREDPYPFCKTPLDFIRVGRICDSADDTNDLTDKLIKGLMCRDTVWEPPSVTTKFGFQTRDNLFANPEGSLSKLDQIIKAEIASYYSEFKSANCLFMELWPKEFRLNGWFVRLLEQGHQDVHIHPSGWLSGVIYLKLPERPNGDEGAIEFGLHGYEYPILNDKFPRTLHRPEKGQIVLFPSSLFHKTKPFSSDDERLSVAFDLVPS